MTSAFPSPSSPTSASEEAYRQAGVNLAGAREVVHHAKQAASKTLRADLGFGGIGGFSGAFRIPQGYSEPVLLAGCDGVGTKLALAQQLQNHSTIGQDLVAMCVNDLLVQGAEPLVFLDYLATGKLDQNVLQAVLASIAEGCVLAGCVLAGGETAEMPGFYDASKYDLAGFSVGVAEASQLYPQTERLRAGDVLIGLSSSGVHSNGYSLVRKLLADNTVDLSQPLEGDSVSIGEALLRPTRIYVKPVLALLKELPQAVKAMVHITGGGFQDNLPRVLPEHLAAEVHVNAWPRQPVFTLLQRLGQLDEASLLHTFNAGIGFVLVVDADQAEAVLQWFAKPEVEAAIGKAYQIGQLGARSSQNEPEVYLR